MKIHDSELTAIQQIIENPEEESDGRPKYWTPLAPIINALRAGNGIISNASPKQCAAQGTRRLMAYSKRNIESKLQMAQLTRSELLKMKQKFIRKLQTLRRRRLRKNFMKMMGPLANSNTRQKMNAAQNRFLQKILAAKLAAAKQKLIEREHRRNLQVVVNPGPTVCTLCVAQDQNLEISVNTYERCMGGY